MIFPSLFFSINFFIDLASRIKNLSMQLARITGKLKNQFNLNSLITDSSNEISELTIIKKKLLCLLNIIK